MSNRKGRKIRQHTVCHKRIICTIEIFNSGLGGKEIQVFNKEGKGNTWWLYNSLVSSIDEPIFVLTCDNIIKINFTSFGNEYFNLNSPACMIIPATPIDNIEGDFGFLNAV